MQLPDARRQLVMITTHDGETLTGRLLGYGCTVVTRRDVPDVLQTFRFAHGVAPIPMGDRVSRPRYCVRLVEDIKTIEEMAEPELPGACNSFSGNGSRCTSCRFHKRLH